MKSTVDTEMSLDVYKRQERRDLVGCLPWHEFLET